jgi:hypothetical protein
MHRFDLEPSTYEGPTGIIGVLADAASAGRADVTISCWAAVPHYAGHSAVAEGDPRPAGHGSPKLIDRPIDTERPARRAGPGVGEGQYRRCWPSPMRRSPNTSTPLEKAQDTAELPEAAGDAIAREFERYLRGQAAPKSPSER